MLRLSLVNVVWGLFVGGLIWSSTKDTNLACAAGAATLCISLSVVAGAEHIAATFRKKD